MGKVILNGISYNGTGPVIDNLVTDDSTKGVSARQAKLLKGMIDDLGSASELDYEEFDTEADPVYLDASRVSVNISGGTVSDAQTEIDGLKSSVSSVEGDVATIEGTVDSISSDISDKFSESASYSAGDYCIYNDILYQFTSAKSAGSWDSSVVSRKTVSQEISTLNASLANSNLGIVSVPQPVYVNSSIIEDCKYLCSLMEPNTPVMCVAENEGKALVYGMTYTKSVNPGYSMFYWHSVGTTSVRIISCQGNEWSVKEL